MVILPGIHLSIAKNRLTKAGQLHQLALDCRLLERRHQLVAVEDAQEPILEANHDLLAHQCMRHLVQAALHAYRAVLMHFSVESFRYVAGIRRQSHQKRLFSLESIADFLLGRSVDAVGFLLAKCQQVPIRRLKVGELIASPVPLA